MGERTPLEFAASQRSGDKETLENSENFEDTTLLPHTSQYPATPTKNRASREVVITYKHVHVFHLSPHSKHTPQDVMQKAALAASSNASGVMVTIAEEKEVEGPGGQRSPTRTFKILDLNLEYTADDIPEVSTLTDTAKNYYDIPRDWESSSYMLILGVPIPVKYWGEIFQNKGSQEFSYRRNKWRQWKVSSPKLSGSYT